MKATVKLHWKSVINYGEVGRLRTLALESFKTLNDLNPTIIKNLLEKREVSQRRKNSLEISNQNSVK